MTIKDSYEFTPDCHKITYKHRTILGNRRTGEWLKLSEECMNILEHGINNRMSPSKLLDCLHDYDDRIYFQRIFDQLENIGLIRSTSYDTSVRRTFTHIYFALTNKCNLFCNHCCYNAKYAASSDPITHYMTTDEALQTIDKIIAAHPQVITFSGGEPMMRDDFFQLLLYTSEHYNGRINISTNGTLISPDNVDLLSKHVDSFDISIDGIDDESCERLRGPGVFERVMTSIALLQSRGVKQISLSMVLMDHNKHLETPFRDLNLRMGTRAVVRRFTPIGRGKVYQKRGETVKIQLPDLRQITNEKAKRYRDTSKFCNCGAGEKMILIDHDGAIYPCGLMITKELKLAQIQELEQIEDMFSSANNKIGSGQQALKDLQPQNFSKCKDCKVNFFCWHCLHHVEQLKGDEARFTERCNAQKSLLYRLIWDEVREANTHC